MRFLFPTGPSVNPPLGAGYPAIGADERFAPRAKASGVAHIDQLRAEATSQVECGWLAIPVELDESGDGIRWNADFITPHSGLRRCRRSKLARARDDFKYGRADMELRTRAPL